MSCACAAVIKWDFPIRYNTLTSPTPLLLYSSTHHPAPPGSSHKPTLPLFHPTIPPSNSLILTRTFQMYLFVPHPSSPFLSLFCSPFLSGFEKEVFDIDRLDLI